MQQRCLQCQFAIPHIPSALPQGMPHGPAAGACALPLTHGADSPFAMCASPHSGQTSGCAATFLS